MSILATMAEGNKRLDATICRAEAGCERVRQAAAKASLHPRIRQRHREALQQLELALSRLQAERRVDRTKVRPAASYDAAGSRRQMTAAPGFL